MPSTPSELGFRMPAEWEPHEATWLAWPHRREDWPEKFEPIPLVYTEIVRHLHRVERVHILVADEAARAEALTHLARVGVDTDRIVFDLVPTDRVWTRDYGPIFVTSRTGAAAVTNWHFNGWAKYADWHADDAVTGQLCERYGWHSWQPELHGRRVVLEGGSIDVNGVGLLLTTEECLLSEVQQRNPGLSRGDVEHALGQYLGVRKVLWLNKGIAGDDTHGHVDDLARFVAPGRVVTVVEEQPNDPNFEPLRENLDRLRTMTDLSGRPLEVIPLPMPAPVWFKEQRLPASYANFYIANGLVLVPTFNDPNDRRALAILAEQFPERTVVGIHAVDLVWGLGTLHCLTQQQPRAVGN